VDCGLRIPETGLLFWRRGGYDEIIRFPGSEIRP
jgi:hypothetical protein